MSEFMSTYKNELLSRKKSKNENKKVSEWAEKVDPYASDASLKTRADSTNEADLADYSTTVQQDTQLRKTPNHKLDNFIWTTSPQPHAVRRRLILQQYPQIEHLYGNDPCQAIPALLTVVCQVFLSYLVSQSHLPMWLYAFVICVISGTLNHSLFAAMHEGSHRTIFKGKLSSEIFCIATTLPMGLPAAIPFKRYHLDHHIYQGVTVMDPDIPTEAEAWFFRSTLRKLLWVAILPITYSMRPMITHPKEMVFMDLIGWIVSICFDLAVYRFWGLKSLLYLLLGTAFSMNFHPFAGHFISEHFILPNSDIYQETSSYYGWCNLITYNVGYHNEHHDFPRVPGSWLPLIREIAPEYYDIPEHTSWFQVTWKFILSSPVTPFNRVKRLGIKESKLPDSLLPYKYHEGVIPYGSSHHFWPKITVM